MSRWPESTTIRGVRHNTTTRDTGSASWVVRGGVVTVLDYSLDGHTVEVGGQDLGVCMDIYRDAGALWGSVLAEFERNRATYMAQPGAEIRPRVSS